MSPEERSAIKARCEKPISREAFIMGGPRAMGIVAEQHRRDALAMHAEVERLERERDAALSTAAQMFEASDDALTKIAGERTRITARLMELGAERDAALADAARLRAALESWRVNFGTIDDTLRWMKQREDVLAAPAGDDALREFGLRVATQARKVHARFGGSQVDAAAIVDAVLRGER